MLFASAYAGSGKKDTESAAVPLEKKLDKRGLLNLGYGYGINGLDVGYLGGGSHLGGVHGLSLGHSGLSLGHNGWNGWNGYNSLSGGYGHNGVWLGGHTDVLKTVTLLKGVPVPVPVEKHIPYPVEKHIPYAVKVPVPHPVEVVKHVPYSVKEYVKVPVHVPQPYEVIKHIPYPVHVPVDRPVPVKVLVPQPYEVTKHIAVPVKVPVPQPYEVTKHVPYPVKVEVPVPAPYPVEKHVGVPVHVPVDRPVPVHVVCTTLLLSFRCFLYAILIYSNNVGNSRFYFSHNHTQFMLIDQYLTLCKFQFHSI